MAYVVPRTYVQRTSHYVGCMFMTGASLSLVYIAWVFCKESRLTGVNIDQNLDKRHENTTYP